MRSASAFDLAADDQQYFSNRLGIDFSNVQAHDGSDAAEAADAPLP